MVSVIWILLGLAAVTVWTPNTSATVIHSRCGKFYCPDHCDISYRNGCPHNCNCKKTLTSCPRVTCPAPAPTCLIYTQLDGCQSCACQRPFIEVGQTPAPAAGNGNPQPPPQTPATTDFIFLGEERDPNIGLESGVSPSGSITLRKAHLINTTPFPPTEAPIEKFPKVPAAPPPPPSAGSLENPASQFSLNIAQPETAKEVEVAPPPFTPEQERKIGELVDARRDPWEKLLEADKSDREEGRLGTTLPPQPVPARAQRPSLERVEVLSEKESLACTPAHQQSINAHFSTLYRELLRMQDQASAAFPVAYAFSKRQLENRCDQFKIAMENIQPATKRNCIRDQPFINYTTPLVTRNEMYNMVYFGLGYPCGYGTRDYFLRYFDCLVGVKRRSETVKRCEELANHRLNDASLDVCETYDVMADCMYDTVVKSCGYDGWEIEYQYLSMNLRNKHDCKLRRIFRSVDAPQTQRTA